MHLLLLNDLVALTDPMYGVRGEDNIDNLMDEVRLLTC